MSAEKDENCYQKLQDYVVDHLKPEYSYATGDSVLTAVDSIEEPSFKRWRSF
jgi:hypothetical protein